MKDACEGVGTHAWPVKLLKRVKKRVKAVLASRRSSKKDVSPSTICCERALCIGAAVALDILRCTVILPLFGAGVIAIIGAAAAGAAVFGSLVVCVGVCDFLFSGVGWCLAKVVQFEQ